MNPYLITKMDGTSPNIIFGRDFPDACCRYDLWVKKIPVVKDVGITIHWMNVNDVNDAINRFYIFNNISYTGEAKEIA